MMPAAAVASDVPAALGHCGVHFRGNRFQILALLETLLR
jgi:hypothetical protein